MGNVWLVRVCAVVGLSDLAGRMFGLDYRCSRCYAVDIMRNKQLPQKGTKNTKLFVSFVFFRG